MSEFAELHAELRDVARDLLGRATEGRLDWSLAVEVGWPGLEIDPACDGSGATFAETAVVIEELGRGAIAAPLFGTAVLGVGLLHELESTEGRERLLREIAGGALGAVALAPGGDGSEADPAFRVSNGRLDGRATFVADAASADHLLVLAAADDGGVVVAHVDPGAVTVTPDPVVDESRDFATVTADGAPATDVWCFADDPAAAMRAVTDRAAAAVALDSMGVATAMLDATVAYVGERRQFDRAIGSFQAVKHQCADMLVGLTVGRELLDAAVDAVSCAAPDATEHVARAKAFVTATAVDVVGTAMQLHGGIGYTWESGVHRHLKRAILARNWFGTPAAHRRRLGASLVD